MLVLTPNTITRNPFHLDALSELIKEPKVGNKTQYRFYEKAVKEKLRGKSYPSH